LIYKRLAQESLNAEKLMGCSRFEKDFILVRIILMITLGAGLIRNLNLVVKLMPFSVKTAQNVRI